VCNSFGCYARFEAPPTQMDRVLFVVKAREFGGLEIILLDWLAQVDYTKTSIAVCSYGTDALRTRLAALGPGVESVTLDIADDAPFWRELPGWIRLLSSLHPSKVIFLEGLVGDFSASPVLAAWLCTRFSHSGCVYIYESNWGKAVPPKGGKRKLHYGFLPGIGLYRRKEMFKQKWRVRLTRRIFTMSQGIKNNLAMHFGCAPEHISVLHHGVNTARYSPCAKDRLAFRQANGIPEDAVVLVSHGRLVRRKRIERLLQAFELLYAEHPNVWLVVTAYGPLSQEMEKAVASSPARSRVKLVGFQEDPTKILKASDIYVLSSNDEGFGIALVEALSTGLVCVATKGPGPTDILEGGESGFLVEESVEGVAAGLRQALALTPQQRTQMSERARKTVQTCFEIGTVIRQALDALEIPHK
jgi:glycosyltransferase involved in cell wall biosynthesis